MKEIEELFKLVEDDYEAFRNMAMYIMTIFVNRGIIELGWDLTSQDFVFTVVNHLHEWELEQKPEFLLDPDELLKEAMKRKRPKKNDGSK